MQMDNCSSTNTFKARLNVPVFKSLFSYFKPAPTHNDSNQRKPRFSHISLLSRIWWQTKERILPLRQISSSPQKFARPSPPPFLLHVFANLQYRQLITNYLLCFTFLLLFLSLLRVIIQNVIQIFWNHLLPSNQYRLCDSAPDWFVFFLQPFFSGGKIWGLVSVAKFHPEKI